VASNVNSSVPVVAN